MKVERVKVEESWKGLTVRGTVVFGDSEGDYSVPGGVRELGPYVEDGEVVTEEGEDVLQFFDENGQGIVEDVLIEGAYSRLSDR